MIHRIAAAVVLSLITLATRADDAAKPRSLFDGKSLDGWTVTECKAEVQDGAILLKEGNGLVRTNDKFADFVLELDWKALKSKDWDSGIFVRFDLPLPKGRNWPKQHQVNLRQGDEGNIATLKTARSKGLVKDGEWNHFKLTVKGDKATLEINGEGAWKAEGIAEKQGYIGLQAEVPLGGQFLFRDLKITELKSK